MHPRIVELLAYAQLQRVTLLDAVSLFPEPRRDRRVDAGTWSVAEVLEHLYRVESDIARLLTRSLERARVAGPEPESEAGSVLASLDAFRLLDGSLRMTAPELVMPRGELTAAQGLVALTESRRALILALEAGDGLALGRITRAHPLFGPLNLYQWALFVGQHEARHAAQLRDLARQLLI
jgi:DinB family protein